MWGNLPRCPRIYISCLDTFTLRQSKILFITCLKNQHSIARYQTPHRSIMRCLHTLPQSLHAVGQAITPRWTNLNNKPSSFRLIALRYLSTSRYILLGVSLDRGFLGDSLWISSNLESSNRNQCFGSQNISQAQSWVCNLLTNSS